MEESNNVSPQQNQAVQISPELNGENVYNEVNRSLTLMSRFLREEQFNAQKALRAKTVIQNAQTSIKNSLSEAILALEFGSHESNSNMLENLM